MILYDFDKKKYKNTIREEGREEGRIEGMKLGLEQGLEQGKTIMLLGLIRDGEITIESAASRMNLSKEEFLSKYGDEIGK